MNNVMCDLETLDKTATSVIIAIGAVEFDPILGLGQKFYQIVDAQSCVDVGLTLGADTVMWWMKQDVRAKTAFNEKGIELKEVLRMFADWYPKGADLWGNGAMFDNVILANAYDRTRIQRPWGYKADRCYRTLRALYPEVEAVKDGGVMHNALDDAVYQAKHAVTLLRHTQGVGPLGELKRL
jgi:hypothetical protein